MLPDSLSLEGFNHQLASPRQNGNNSGISWTRPSRMFDRTYCIINHITSINQYIYNIYVQQEWGVQYNWWILVTCPPKYLLSACLQPAFWWQAPAKALIIRSKWGAPKESSTRGMMIFLASTVRVSWVSWVHLRGDQNFDPWRHGVSWGNSKAMTHDGSGSGAAIKNGVPWIPSIYKAQWC